MIHHIKEQRALAVAEMRGMVEKAQAEKRNLSADEAAKFDSLKAKITSLEEEETRATFIAEAERRMSGTPVSGDRSFTELESNVSLLSVIRAGMEGRALSGAEAEYSREVERRTGHKAGGTFVPLSVLEKRVNLTSTAGQIVPVDHRPDQFIDPLRNKLLARSLGVRVLSGLQGDVSIPAYGSGVTSGWVAENGALTASDMTFASKSLTLTLQEDKKGLYFELSLPDTSYARDLGVLVERGDISGCSFGFHVPDGGATWDMRSGQLTRDLIAIDLHEITITANPAYLDTTVAKRSMEEWKNSQLEANIRWIETCEDDDDDWMGRRCIRLY